jgi:uncharacterized protein YbjT (DUF2867 family)
MSPRTIAISGASGKTGYRIAEQLLQRGDQPRLLLRPASLLPESLQGCDQRRLELSDAVALDDALTGVDGLVIATGARPSLDLSGPMRVDAWGVQRQVESCRRVGVRRVLLVSSLCAGRWRHPLNLFGLILVWKRVGERALERSGLDWTVIRPGGLSEREDGLESEGILWTRRPVWRRWTPRSRSAGFLRSPAAPIWRLNPSPRSWQLLFEYEFLQQPLKGLRDNAVAWGFLGNNVGS